MPDNQTFDTGIVKHLTRQRSGSLCKGCNLAVTPVTADELMRYAMGDQSGKFEMAQTINVL